MPRLVRRAPLMQRIKSYLNPIDLLLRLHEELESNDWDQFQKDWATIIGVALNFLFLIARSNTGRSTNIDDVFGDTRQTMGWIGWLMTFIVHALTILSISNAAYTFLRRRHYRLFETSLNEPPSTPSAQRVRVDSSPMASSPLRFLSSMLPVSSAQSRAHPDATKEVWELAVWDPLPLCLKLFCVLSPGHVLMYWLLLPAAIHDPRPSSTVAITIVVQVLLSTQLFTLQSRFSQQTKDTAVIHKEVLHEYDTKYVHPMLHPRVRDVGIQAGGANDTTKEVDTYTTTTVINRGFKTNPNPSYAKHFDPDDASGLRQQTHLTRPVSRGSVSTAIQTPRQYEGYTSPVKSRSVIPQPRFTSGDGGSLGVYTHANSPLKKAASSYSIGERKHDDASYYAKERSRSPQKRENSPIKRSSVPGGLHRMGDMNRAGFSRTFA